MKNKFRVIAWMGIVLLYSARSFSLDAPTLSFTVKINNATKINQILDSLKKGQVTEETLVASQGQAIPLRSLLNGQKFCLLMRFENYPNVTNGQFLQFSGNIDPAGTFNASSPANGLTLSCGAVVEGYSPSFADVSASFGSLITVSQQ